MLSTATFTDLQAGLGGFSVAIGTRNQAQPDDESRRNYVELTAVRRIFVAGRSTCPIPSQDVAADQ